MICAPQHSCVLPHLNYTQTQGTLHSSNCCYWLTPPFHCITAIDTIPLRPRMQRPLTNTSFIFFQVVSELSVQSHYITTGSLHPIFTNRADVYIYQTCCYENGMWTDFIYLNNIHNMLNSTRECERKIPQKYTTIPGIADHHKKLVIQIYTYNMLRISCVLTKKNPIIITY